MRESRDVLVLRSKLRVPELADGMVRRPRLLACLTQPARAVLVVAPPGFGKTTIVAQWAADCTTPVAWISVDLLDESPPAFWRHLIEAIHSIVPVVDEDARAALEEDPGSPLFLAILIAQIERFDGHAIIVLDSFSPLLDRSIADGLALLVDRVGDRLQLVMTARVDPPMPLARWRTQGWLVDLRVRELRLDDSEALEISATFGDRRLADELVLHVNRRAAGWPIAFHLALVCAAAVEHPEAELRSLVASDRELSDFIVAEILDQMPAAERGAVLDLSILEWFDPELAEDLAGPPALAAISELRRRRLLVTGGGDRADAMRFHPLFRELMESELHWRDPSRHHELHRRAAEIWARRREIPTAYRHLVALGDDAAAHELIMGQVLRLVNASDHAGLRDLMWRIPSEAAVVDPDLAIDLAIATFYAGDANGAHSWMDRADELVGERPTPSTQLRIHTAHAVLDLMDGHLAQAAEHVRSFEQLRRHADISGPIEQRFATVAARLALCVGDVDAAGRWLTSVTAEIPEPVERVTLPALVAWKALLEGQADEAARISAEACAAAQVLGLRPHHGAFDALVTAAWAAFALGDLERAEEYANAARADVKVLGYPWNIVRATEVAARVRLHTTGPDSALAVLRSAQPALAEARRVGELTDDLALVEAIARRERGDLEAAQSIAGSLVERPGTRTFLASLALDARAPAAARDLLAEHATWRAPDRIAASVVSALANGRRSDLRAAVEVGRATGFVSPFLGLGRRVTAALGALPLEELHPALARHFPRPGAAPAAPTRKLVEALTERELTILELLPTHLSYAEIGARLYLSVNTVKSNLKVVYRKLGVTTRSEAVAAAREARLI